MAVSKPVCFSHTGIASPPNLAGQLSGLRCPSASGPKQHTGWRRLLHRAVQARHPGLACLSGCSSPATTGVVQHDPYLLSSCAGCACHQGLHRVALTLSHIFPVSRIQILRLTTNFWPSAFALLLLPSAQVVSAIKFSIVDRPHPIDAPLAASILGFLSMMADADRNVRKVRWSLTRMAGVQGLQHHSAWASTLLSGVAQGLYPVSWASSP